MQRMRSVPQRGWTAYAGPAVVVAMLAGVGWWAWVAMGPQSAGARGDEKLSLAASANNSAGQRVAATEQKKPTPTVETKRPTPTNSGPGAGPTGAPIAANTPTPNTTGLSAAPGSAPPVPPPARDEVLTPRDAGSPLATPGPSAVQPPTLLQATTPPTSQPAGSTRIAEQPLKPAPSATPASPTAAPSAPAPAPSSPVRAGIAEAGRRKMLAGDFVGARNELNAALRASRSDGPAERDLRETLTQIADKCTFSKETVEGDTLAAPHKVAQGDRIIKLAKSWKVPYEIILDINAIQSERKIRAGQTIKTLRGPFNARISKSQFRLDLYLQDTYVRSYQVGLGAANGTPEGEWKVENRLKNPTYYPPASSDKKKIISPDDPSNPLGEHWIGLTGISGAAKGQEGFGIHGTIEPNSIGKNASMGCVRMRNEDVAFVYKLLEPGASIVTIVP